MDILSTKISDNQVRWAQAVGPYVIFGVGVIIVKKYLDGYFDEMISGVGKSVATSKGVAKGNDFNVNQGATNIAEADQLLARGTDDFGNPWTPEQRQELLDIKEKSLKGIEDTNGAKGLVDGVGRFFNSIF